jgi:hypothetical protein
MDTELDMVVATICVFYHPNTHAFTTADGKRIYNLHRLVSPSLVSLFIKYYKKTTVFYNYKYHVKVKLLYPTSE